MTVGHLRARNVFGGEAAFVVRGPRQRHAAVVDGDVGMMVRGFRIGDQAIDERDGLRKSLERELLPDRIAIERPLVERLQLLVDLLFSE